MTAERAACITSHKSPREDEDQTIKGSGEEVVVHLEFNGIHH